MLPECSIIIFGSTGDLAKKKLIPALYRLFAKGQLHPQTQIIGIGRKSWDDGRLRKQYEECIGKEVFSKRRWSAFAKRISYHRLEFHDDDAYAQLSAKLLHERRICYLATPQEAFPLIVQKLHGTGIALRSPARGWHRIVFEKPFGSSLSSARALNREIVRFYDESQVYRIDHYVGKSFVHEILILRLANPMFERLWNCHGIEQVHLSVHESDGVGERTGYYDSAGALRDMVQNHLMQLLALTAMEPPKSMSPAHIRDAKTKLLKSVAIPRTEHLIVGQYRAGGKQKGYRDEVGERSQTETYAAVRLGIDNARWKGVPFFLSTGKALREHYAQIEIVFRKGDWIEFSNEHGLVDQDRLVIKIQPQEGLRMWLNLSDDTLNPTVYRHELDFTHETGCGLNTVDAYELLLAECIEGDQTLFTRWDFVEQSWKITDALQREKRKLHFYPAGSQGPLAGLRLLRGG